MVPIHESILGASEFPILVFLRSPGPTASQRVPGFRNEIFFTRSRKPGTHPQDGESEQSEDKSGDYAEAYLKYVAQGILQIDAEIVKNSHLWMETK